jgi:hypothetical protein
MGLVSENWTWGAHEEEMCEARAAYEAARERLDKKITRDGADNSGFLIKLQNDVANAQRNFERAEWRFLNQPSCMGGDGE